MDRSGEVIERARSQIDRSCYVWGAEGQDLNAMSDPVKWIKAQETTGDRARNVARDLAQYEKLMRKGYDPILCFDCSGFVYWTLKPFGLVTGRRSAAGYYAQAEHKTRGQLRAGDLLFVWNGTKICHVGIYAGNDRAIHCKGRDTGVIEEGIGKHGWNRYGKVKGMYDDDPPQPVPPGTYVFTRTLRYGDKGEDVVELKRLLITHGYTEGITIDTASSPVYGGQTRARVKEYQRANDLVVDGIAGKNTITSLGGIYK